MPDRRLPKRLFYDEPRQGKRSHGGQKKRFKDTLKTCLKVFNINPNTWEQTALDRARRRYSIYKGANLCEERRTAAAQQKRRARKARPSNQAQVSHIPCPSCRRTFRARIGLIRHLSIHKSSLPPVLSPPRPPQPLED